MLAFPKIVPFMLNVKDEEPCYALVRAIPAFNHGARLVLLGLMALALAKAWLWEARKPPLAVRQTNGGLSDRAGVLLGCQAQSPRGAGSLGD
jgi:hypothetical protein